MLLNCGVGEDLRVPWTARRSNQSILKEISPGCSLEGLMLKLKLQYFGHLMWRVDSLEKTLMLGGIGGRRRRGWQRVRWLNGITNLMGMNLSKLWGFVMDREAWRTVIHGVVKSQTLLSNWTEMNWTCTLGRNVDRYSHYGRWYGNPFKKLGIKPAYDSAIPLLDIYPEIPQTETDTCILLFTAALFTIVWTWKQPRCPSTDECISKQWYIYTMEYCSAIKRRAFESILMRWMNLEPIIQWMKSEWSQISSVAYLRISAICISEDIDISPDNLDSILCFLQHSVSHDLLCI